MDLTESWRVSSKLGVNVREGLTRVLALFLYSEKWCNSCLEFGDGSEVGS